MARRLPGMQGKDEDHAELVSLIRQEHQVQIAQCLEQHQSPAESLKVTLADARSLVGPRDWSSGEGR